MMPTMKKTTFILLILIIILGCAGTSSQETRESSQPSATQLPEAWSKIRSTDQRAVKFVFDITDMKVQTTQRLKRETADDLIKHFAYRLQHAIKTGLEDRGFVLDPAATTQYVVGVDELALNFKGQTDYARMKASATINVDINRFGYPKLVSRQISAEALGSPYLTYNFKEYSRLISKCTQELVSRAFPKRVLQALVDTTDPTSLAQTVTERPSSAETATAPLAAAFPPGDTSALDFGTYYALVIGNNAYQSMPPLKTAVNDAQVVAKILKDKYGFSVQTLTDATRADILRALHHLRRTLGVNDNLLIYYAGHGWLDKAGDEGYWLPVDADKDIETNWISNSYMTTTLRAIEAKHVMVVADSCYSGKLTRGVNIKNRSASYLARIVKKRSRTVLSSGGLEPVIDSGGKDNHSVFASAFIDALSENDGIVDATQIFTQIRRVVMLNAYQMPEYADIRYAGHDGGDFLFVPLKTAD